MYPNEAVLIVLSKILEIFFHFESLRRPDTKSLIPSEIVSKPQLELLNLPPRIKGITDMTVELDFPDSNLTFSQHIGEDNILDVVSVEPDNVWGHVNVFARYGHYQVQR